MRQLQTHDIFKALKIANSAKIKEEFQKIALRITNGESVNEREIGFDFIMTVLGNCADDLVERQIYDFIGGILEIPSEEIETMNPLELIEKIKELKTVISVEEWKSFFQSLSQMLMK